MELPFTSDGFDAAVMALVLVFVPDPAKGIAEMIRVVRPGGTVATYIWDMLGGGFPLDPIGDELRAMGIAFPRAPQMDASRMDVLQDLWAGAGLEAVETREITVHRTFANFDEFWTTNLKSPALGPVFSAMASADLATIKNRVSRALATDAEGRIVCAARAHAAKGYRAK